MTKVITNLLSAVARDVCLEYAQLELQRNKQRKLMARLHPAAAYFLSTENKRHLSNLLYVAHATRKPVSKLKAASELGITRQAVSGMLDETTDAGWVVKKRRGYMYSDEMAARYTHTISKMLLTMSSDLAQKVVRLADLNESMSSHLSLTESQIDTLLQAGGEQYAQKDKKNKPDAVFNEKRIVKI